MTLKELQLKVENVKPLRGAWSKGIVEYMNELVEDTIEGYGEDYELPESTKEFNKLLLSGADTWKDYSYGGSSLIFNDDIAERLSNASELKQTKNGQLPPNKNEEWLDVQARALYQASNELANLVFNRPLIYTR